MELREVDFSSTPVQDIISIWYILQVSDCTELDVKFLQKYSRFLKKIWLFSENDGIPSPTHTHTHNTNTQIYTQTHTNSPTHIHTHTVPCAYQAELSLRSQKRTNNSTVGTLRSYDTKMNTSS